MSSGHLTELIDPPARGRVFAQTARAGLAECAPSGRMRLDALARWLQDVAYADVEDAGVADTAVWVVRRTRMRVELARAQLRYGEWLRRQDRRVEARTQLRTAHEAFGAIGAEAFAEQAYRELAATGITVNKHPADAPSRLTAQEGHIARLAAAGRTNIEIAAELYLSPRTVEWHLRKIFTKLDVKTRRQLRQLPQAALRGTSA